MNQIQFASIFPRLLNTYMLCTSWLKESMFVRFFSSYLQFNYSHHSRWNFKPFKLPQYLKNHVFIYDFMREILWEKEVLFKWTSIVVIKFKGFKINADPGRFKSNTQLHIRRRWSQKKMCVFMYYIWYVYHSNDFIFVFFSFLLLLFTCCCCSSFKVLQHFDFYFNFFLYVYSNFNDSVFKSILTIGVFHHLVYKKNVTLQCIPPITSIVWCVCWWEWVISFT